MESSTETYDLRLTHQGTLMSFKDGTHPSIWVDVSFDRWKELGSPARIRITIEMLDQAVDA
jgi:hypothetical protein